MPVSPRRGRVAVLCCAVLLGACENLGTPEPATEEATAIHGLWRLFFYVALGVAIVVWGLVVWCTIRYRRRDDRLPAQRATHKWLEVLYTAIPLVLVAFLFVRTLGVLDEVETTETDPELTVDVTAFQWQWRFDYVDAGVRVTGTIEEPPVVVLPVDTPIRFLLDSPDVVHSFYVPAFLFKLDVIPGNGEAVDVRLEREGTFGGACAEFCGLLHDRMLFTVRSVSRAEFDAWLAEQREPAS